MNLGALLTAWGDWDTRPGRPETANTMEDQCQAVAAELGITATELRAGLSASRRSGMNRQQSVNALAREAA